MDAERGNIHSGLPVRERYEQLLAGQTWLDVAWEFASGRSLPLDHGYALYSTLCALQPWIHDDPHVLIGPVRGGVSGQTLIIREESRLRMRVPVGYLERLRALDGAVLEVNRHMVRLGRLSAHTLVPCRSLEARMVTIRVHTEQGPKIREGEEFWSSLAKQLAPPILAGTERVTVGARRVLQVGHRTIVGFGVRVDGIGPDESLRLQVCGAGGRRHFGCGWFEEPG